jgi:hypothetical protein
MTSAVDGVARFETDQDLVDRGGCGIRRRNHRRHDPHRLRDLIELLLRHLPDDTHRFHVLDEMIDVYRGKLVLNELVLDDPVSGLLDGELG